MSSILLLIASGGAIGAVSRYLTGIAATHLLGDVFPFGTLIVNFVGCLAMGFVSVLLIDGGSNSTKFIPFIMTGFFRGVYYYVNLYTGCLDPACQRQV